MNDSDLIAKKMAEQKHLIDLKVDPKEVEDAFPETWPELERFNGEAFVLDEINLNRFIRLYDDFLWHVH